MRKTNLKDMIIIILSTVILILSISLARSNINLKLKDQKIEMLKWQLEGNVKIDPPSLDKIKEFEANFKTLISLYETSAVSYGINIDNNDKRNALEDKCVNFKKNMSGAEYEINFYRATISARLSYSDTQYVLKYDVKTKTVTAENPPEGSYEWTEKK